MSAKRTRKPTHFSEPTGGGRTDWKHLRSMTEAEIEVQVPPEYRNLPADFWDDAVLVMPGPKHAISLRVDEEVLAWFKRLGPRYQTRMNAVLRSYMKSAAAKPRKRGSN